MHEQDILGNIIIESDGLATIKYGDKGCRIIHVGSNGFEHENVVIASGVMIGSCFYSNNIDVLR